MQDTMKPKILISTFNILSFFKIFNEYFRFKISKKISNELNKNEDIFKELF